MDRVGKNAEASHAPSDEEFDGRQGRVDGEGEKQNPPDPAGASGLVHGRRSATPPLRGRR